MSVASRLLASSVAPSEVSDLVATSVAFLEHNACFGVRTVLLLRRFFVHCGFAIARVVHPRQHTHRQHAATLMCHRGVLCVLACLRAMSTCTV